MGANWIGPTQECMYDLIKEFNLQVQPQFDSGRNVLDLNSQLTTYEGNISELTMFGRPPGNNLYILIFISFLSLLFSNIYFSSLFFCSFETIFSYCEPFNFGTFYLELDAVIEKLNNLSQNIDVENPRTYDKCEEFDHISFGNWINDNVKTEVIK